MYIYIINGENMKVTEVSEKRSSNWEDAIFLGVTSDDNYVNCSSTQGIPLSNYREKRKQLSE